MYINKIYNVLQDFSLETKFTPDMNLMYDIGLDSLEMIWMLTDVEQKCGLPYKSIRVSEFEMQLLTINGLAKKIEVAYELKNKKLKPWAAKIAYLTSFDFGIFKQIAKLPFRQK
jgi:acyl carrier protein